MKKMKFLRSKFCLIATFVFGAFASLILAACEPIKTISTSSETPSATEPETSLILKDMPSEKTKLETKASVEQRVVAIKLLSEPNFSTYLNTTINENELLLNTNAKLVVENVTTKKDIENDTSTSLNDLNAKNLEIQVANFEKVVKDYVTSTQENEFASKLNNAIQALNTLEKETNKVIEQSGKTFENKVFLDAVFVNLKKELKTLSFIKGLKFQNEVAVNLFALHVQDPVHSDVSKLNNYLNQEQKTIQSIWTANNLKVNANNYSHLNLKNALNNLIDQNTWFKNYFISDNNQKSQIVMLLEDALKTFGIKEQDTKVINDFLTEFNKLSTYFNKLYSSFFDLKSTTSVLGLVSHLIAIVDNIDATISGAQNLGSILEVINTVLNMEKVVEEFKNVLPKPKFNSSLVTPIATHDISGKNVVEENPEWLNDLIELHSKRQSLTILKWDNNLQRLIETEITPPSSSDTMNFETAFNALGRHEFTATDLASKMLRILKIEKNGIKQGLLKDSILHLEKMTQWFSLHSDDSLCSQLDQLIHLAKESLNLIQDGDTNKIMSNLAEIYNYGQKNT